MKKIIFIGGTSRSGSTLLDLILANDSKAMSLGEINALFHPTRKHHFEVLFNLKESEVWSSILYGGKKDLFTNLIKHFPEVDIFIDSSKDPFWFKYHQKFKKDNYTIQNVLIHKTPSELANSFMKRGKPTEWINAYIRYHRKYFSLTDNYIAIAYKDVVKSKLYLKRLCEALDLSYFDGKLNYWERKQITFFGSNSVKSYNAHKAKGQLEINERNEVKYDGLQEEFEEYVRKIIVNDVVISTIEEELKKNDVFCINDDEIYTRIGYNKIYLSLISIKRKLKQKYRYYFPEGYF